MGKSVNALKRELNLFQAVMYGVGIILGAGIYVLIGAGAGIAGNAVWIAFAFGAILAAFTGLSYAELSSRHPKNAAEYVYTQKAFGKPALSFVIEWLMLFTVIVSSATVARGFAGYLFKIFSIPTAVGAICLIIALSLISYWGIKESARFAIAATIVEMIGLLIIVAIGSTKIGAVDYFYTPNGISGIFSATAVIFFAYIGFEQMANLAEETKNAKKIIPQALVISIAISSLLYVIVSLAAVSVVGWERLSTSSAPLTEVVMHTSPILALFMSVIALFATSNTVLALLITSSRLLFGLSKNGKLPLIFSKIGSRSTPYASIFSVMVLTICALALGGLTETAMLTDIGVFIVYIFVNLSLITIRLREKTAPKDAFRTPLNIGKVPILAVFGLLTSVFMLFHFEARLLGLILGLIGIGLAVYFLLNSKK